ncbi:hypothetical protein [Caldalkalibacillus mannanilyticus]|uniref:hypothetical protein n=1 Tax=Caldalkalibacillus mannanilyticus TaxID=1418 RepID=UPI0004684965|nr:hypothetical protein [Caldalkalibacillus mannanilyticus]
MNKVMALVMSVIFGVVLSMAVGFVVASIKGFEFTFASAVPYGAALGLILFLFGNLVTAEEK